jgi:hypothetical protein
MDQLLFERLLEDSKLFAPTGGHRTIEIFTPVGSGEPQIRESVLAERQLGPWCRDAGFDGHGSLLRLLICSPRVLDRDIWPLPVTSAMLDTIVKALDVPALFPRAICRHIPLASPFDVFDAAAAAADSDRHGLILRTNLSHTWQYALALVNDPATRVTTGVLFGLRANEVDEVLQSLRAEARSLACPAVLPCTLMDKALDAIVRDAEERRRSLTQIRIETGSAGFREHSIAHTTSSWDDRDDLDLDVLMQKLTSLSDACAGISAVCHMQYGFIDAVSAFQARCELAAGPVEGGSNGVTGSRGSRFARQQLRFFGQFLRGVESKVAYTRSSVSDQVQTIHTLILQRESRSQMEIARTSRRLAELGRKDSTDMRVISAVTLVFLPATFISTFFSASFFDFRPEESAGERHVSAWLWVYWVVTVALTAAVLACWLVFSRRQHQKEREVLRRQSQARQGAIEKFEARLEEEIEPGQPAVEFRPYLGGSVSEGMFSRKSKSTSLACAGEETLTNVVYLVSIVPYQGPKRLDSGNISPTATDIREK